MRVLILLRHENGGELPERYVTDLTIRGEMR